LKKQLSCCSIKSSDSIELRPNDSSEYIENLKEIGDYGRNKQLLSLFSIHPSLEISFQGLKRKLGWHQEILSRTLKKLQKDRIIIKTTSGYYKMNIKSYILRRYCSKVERKDSIIVTKLCLPENLDREVLINRMKNTWFENWRWYSYSEDVLSNTLTWISEDGLTWVSLKINVNVINIEAGPSSSTGRDKCINSGYELLSYLLKIYQQPFEKRKMILQVKQN
jgi:DNA-binding MarR family transcriptional regulator